MRRDWEMASRISKGAQIGQYKCETWEHVYHLHGAMKPKSVRHESAAGYYFEIQHFGQPMRSRHKNGTKHCHPCLHLGRGKGARLTSTPLKRGNNYIIFVQPQHPNTIATGLPQGTPRQSILWPPNENLPPERHQPCLPRLHFGRGQAVRPDLQHVSRLDKAFQTLFRAWDDIRTYSANEASVAFETNKAWS